MLNDKKRKVLRKIARGNIKENKVRNLVLMVAVIAVTIILFTISASGISYFINFSTMNLRLKGTNTDGFVNNLTDAEHNKLYSIDEIYSIGTQYFVGTINSSDNHWVTALSAYDEVEWENNILPTIKNFIGRIPEESNEILLSEGALEALNIKARDIIGKEIELDLNINGILTTKKFKIVGIYEDFIDSNLRSSGSISGNILAASMQLKKDNMQPKANCIVSEEMARKVCPIQNIYTTFQISDGDNIDILIAYALGLNNTDNIMIVKDTNNNGGYIGIVLAIVICVVICLCGYLCIYNIMSIALIKDIHFWGNLKAIGTSGKQLRYIADYETCYFVFRSLPIGLLIGAALTSGFVPFILRTLTGSGGYADIMPFDMHYSLFAFVFTGVFCCATVLVSFKKSLRTLEAMTTIEALRFNGENCGKSSSNSGQHSRCNGKLHKMAWNNVFYDKRRFLTVIFTLFMGLFLFLLSYTLFSSPDWELYLETEAPDDFCITDNTMINNFHEDNPNNWEENYLTPNLYESLKEIDGVSSIDMVCLQPIQIGYEDCLKTYNEKGENENIWGTAVFVDMDKLINYKLAHEKQYNYEKFDDYLNGRIVYVSAAENGSCPEIEGKEIKILNPENGKEVTYNIGGILDANTDNKLGMVQSGTYNEREKIKVFMSNEGIKRLTDNPIIYEIRMNADDGKEAFVKEAIKEIIKMNGKIEIIARSDLLPAYKPVAASFLAIGTIFSGILFIMGIMNFINSLCTNIYTREKELAVLAGIGMSQKQIIIMLVYEGIYYAFTTIALLGTVGICLVYIFMKLTQKVFYFFVFKPPVTMLLMLLALLALICASIPFFTYRGINKKSIVERLKNNDE